MKKILIDLNIILDFLNKRNYHEGAAQLINLCVEKKLMGYICAHEVTTLSYFLLKEQKDKTKVINTITALLDIFTIIPIDESILRIPVKPASDSGRCLPPDCYGNQLIGVAGLGQGLKAFFAENRLSIQSFHSLKTAGRKSHQRLLGLPTLHAR